MQIRLKDGKATWKQEWKVFNDTDVRKAWT